MHRNKTVLVADDSKTVQQVLSHILKNAGFDIITANDGNEAWNILQQPMSPKLIILDWVMPGI